MNEVTRVIAKVLEKPELKYVQFSYEDAEKAMQQAGLSANVAGLMIQMMRSINDGVFKPTEPRGAKNTTPTTFETFAPAFTQIPAPASKPAKRSIAKRR